MSQIASKNAMVHMLQYIVHEKPRQSSFWPGYSKCLVPNLNITALHVLVSAVMTQRAGPGVRSQGPRGRWQVPEARYRVPDAKCQAHKCSDPIRPACGYVSLAHDPCRPVSTYAAPEHPGLAAISNVTRGRFLFLTFEWRPLQSQRQ